MSNFYDRLKEFLVGDSVPNNIPKWGYLDIINKSPHLVGQMVEESKTHDINFSYDCPADDYRYSNGSITIYLYGKENTEERYNNLLPYHYVIGLDINERYTGYCMCTPKDEGYNYDRRCCGTGCDWDEPSLSVTKVISLGSKDFEGYEKDLWELENQWKGLREKSQEEKKAEQVKYIEDQIQVLKNQLKAIR